jgi:hypothetical protein
MNFRSLMVVKTRSSLDRHYTLVKLFTKRKQRTGTLMGDRLIPLPVLIDKHANYKGYQFISHFSFVSKGFRVAKGTRL